MAGAIVPGVVMVTGAIPKQNASITPRNAGKRGCLNSSQSYFPSTPRCLGNIFAILKRQGQRMYVLTFLC